MRLSRKKLGFSAALLLLAACLPFALGRKKNTPAANQMDEHKRIVHALNRLTFGPRPGDIERVSAVGLDKWIDQQLHPEKIDDSSLDARLAQFPTLQMSTEQIVAELSSAGNYSRHRKWQSVHAIRPGPTRDLRSPTGTLPGEAGTQTAGRSGQRQHEQHEPTLAHGQALTDEEIARRNDDRLANNVNVDQHSQHASRSARKSHFGDACGRSNRTRHVFKGTQTQRINGRA